MRVFDLELLRYVSQMAWDGVPSATILFFKLIYPELSKQPMKSIEMADFASISPQGAQRHRKLLERLQYLTRSNRQEWHLNRMALRSPFDQMAV